MILHTSLTAARMHPLLSFLGLMAVAITYGCSGGSSTSDTPSVDGTAGAEEAVGERLFLETRFAQAFKVFVDNGGNINDPNAGDAVVDTVETTGLPITPGPFAGTAMNCRACHMVDDVLTAPGGGMRTYADFARRSPIPARADGKTHAPRNSPALVNSTLDRPNGVLFHFDAEFNSMEDLVAATFTGRNFGWLPGEKAQAVAHVAQIVRGDDGSGNLAQSFDGQSYRILFTGTNAAIPDDFKLPPAIPGLCGIRHRSGNLRCRRESRGRLCERAPLLTNRRQRSPHSLTFRCLLGDQWIAAATRCQRNADRLQPALTDTDQRAEVCPSVRCRESKPARRSVSVSHTEFHIWRSGTRRSEDVPGRTGGHSRLTGRTDGGQNRQLPRLPCRAEFYRL